MVIVLLTANFHPQSRANHITTNALKWILLILTCSFIGACERGAKASEDGKSISTEVTSANQTLDEDQLSIEKQPSVKEKGPDERKAPILNKVEPLSDSDLRKIGEPALLVLGSDSSYRPGIFVKGPPDSRGYFPKLMVSPTINEENEAHYAGQSSSGLIYQSSSKIADLPNGLSIYSTSRTLSPKSSFKNILDLDTSEDSTEGPFYCIKIVPAEFLSEKEKTDLASKIELLQTQLDEAKAKERQIRRAPSSRTNTARTRLTRNEERQYQSDIRHEIGTLSSQLKQCKITLEIPIKKAVIKEIARANSLTELEEVGDQLDNSFLVSDRHRISAIRHQGQWLELNMASLKPEVKLEKVSIDLSSTGENVSITCDLKESLLYGQPAYSLIAATTYELESLGSGSIEERLAKVQSTPFPESGDNRRATKRVKWNRSPTTLWVKVFRDDSPGTPVIEESIDLNYVDGFSARWQKQPSPLIEVPDPEPDSPENLVRSSSTIDVGGTILDIIAAEGGSVVLVRTDHEPYWAPLNLETGELSSPPWEAGPDTLLATQAGKTYLLNPKTKLLEIWNLSSQTRVGIELLQIADEIIALAAPSEAKNQPVLVTTETNTYFLDPENFEVMATGFVFDEALREATKKNRNFPHLDPKRTWARVSSDGTLYVLNGLSRTASSHEIHAITAIVDTDGFAQLTRAGRYKMFLASRGRQISKNYPDHGGSEVSLVAKAGESHRSSGYLGSPGSIKLITDEDQDTSIASLNNPPLLPRKAMGFEWDLVPDRQLYFDSRQKTLLLPDSDKIHLLRLTLPKLPRAVAPYLLAGETLEIPLPKGFKHKLETRVGGDTTIKDSMLFWKPPVDLHQAYLNPKLQWTGELGSRLDKKFSIAIYSAPEHPTIVSSDNLRKLAIKPKGYITTEERLESFAGSGHVMLTGRHNKEFSAWNLDTCKPLFTIEESFLSLIGDIGHAYVKKDSGTIKSYDLKTGNLLNTAELANNRPHSVKLLTGMSSSLPLLAIAEGSPHSKIYQIDRHSMQKELVSFNPEKWMLPLMFWNTKINSVGSSVATSHWNICRSPESTEFHYTKLPPNQIGTPDLTGRFLVSEKNITYAGQERVHKIPSRGKFDHSDSTTFILDESGKFLLVCEFSEKDKMMTASVRDFQLIGNELFKIKVPTSKHHKSLWLLSGSSTMITRSSGRGSVFVVYDFDIPEILKRLRP